MWRLFLLFIIRQLYIFFNKNFESLETGSLFVVRHRTKKGVQDEISRYITLSPGQ